MAANTGRFTQFDAAFGATREAIAKAEAFERAAKEELEQHRRWLSQYADQELRSRQTHERRLKRYAIEHRREVKRRYLRRVARARGLAAWTVIRRTSLACWALTVLVASTIFAALTSAFIWTVDKISRAAIFGGRQIADATVWSARQVAAASVWTASKLALVWAWLTPRVQALASRLMRWAAAAGVWLYAQAFTGAVLVMDGALAILSWTAVQAHDFSRALPIWFEGVRSRAHQSAQTGQVAARSVAQAAAAGTLWSARRSRVAPIWTARTGRAAIDRLWQTIPAVGLAAKPPAPVTTTALVLFKPACTALALYVPPAPPQLPALAIAPAPAPQEAAPKRKARKSKKRKKHKPRAARPPASVHAHPLA